jgi:hypothetical protein
MYPYNGNKIVLHDADILATQSLYVLPHEKPDNKPNKNSISTTPKAEPKLCELKILIRF